MKPLITITLIFSLLRCQAQIGLVNPGFETADFTGWIGYKGDNTQNSTWELDNLTQGVFYGVIDPPFAYQTWHSLITTSSGVDPIGGFPIVPTGYGNVVAKLGNDSVSFQGQKISQTWVVNAAQPIVYPSYAVVLSYAPGHPVIESNYFTFCLFDSIGDTIFSRRSEGHGFPAPAGYTLMNNHYVLPWTIDTFDLSAYIGTQVTIEFKTAGCIWGGHYSYCYVDLNPNDFTGTNDIAAEHDCKVYPNPSITGLFNLITDQTSNDLPYVVDLSGRAVEAVVTKTTNGWTIDLSQSAAGVYLLNVPTSNGIAQTQLIR